MTAKRSNIRCGSRAPRWQGSLLCLAALLLFAVLPAVLAFVLASDHLRYRHYYLDGRTVAAVAVDPAEVTDLRTVFEAHGFDLEGVKNGAHRVPPIFARALPGDWEAELPDVDTRKRVFAKTLIPLILKENARIRADRGRLSELAARAGGDPEGLGVFDRRWLRRLAEAYRLEAVEFETLLRRVDEVPVSLALVQAANESGWGGSRFAHEGNALFGEWTWDTEAGIVPEALQDGLKPYAVRRFDSLALSVAAYMKNLNTHAAYRDFREMRAARRAEGERLDGLALAPAVIAYSQRGADYVMELEAMIRQNGYQALDEARLAPRPRDHLSSAL